MKIKRLGVLKMAGFTGVYGAFMGLIFGAIFSLVALIAPSSSTAIVGVFAIILFPLVYGITGFLSALIFTPIVNLSLKVIKGLDIELIEETSQMVMQ